MVDLPSKPPVSVPTWDGAPSSDVFLWRRKANAWLNEMKAMYPPDELPKSTKGGPPTPQQVHKRFIIWLLSGFTDQALLTRETLGDVKMNE
jgi:hypothetical protein